MDADRFDALSRALSTTHPRRRLTRLLGGLGVGGVLSVRTAEEAIAASRIGGESCSKDEQCKTDKCLSGKCSCSRKIPACTQPANPCKQATCNFKKKRCVTGPKNDGARCGSGKRCSGGVCATPPGCQNGACSFNFQCCSDNCFCVDAEAPFGVCESPGSCFPGADGKPCNRDGDCISSNCVGFKCRP